MVKPLAIPPISREPASTLSKLKNVFFSKELTPSSGGFRSLKKSKNIQFRYNKQMKNHMKKHINMIKYQCNYTFFEKKGWAISYYIVFYHNYLVFYHICIKYSISNHISSKNISI